MNKIIILVGPPGSGKSTLALEYAAQGYVRINQDTQGSDGHRVAFYEALNEKKDILIDRMNFNKEQRFRYLIPAKEADYEAEIHVLHESYDTCLARCLKRIDHPTIKTEADAKKALDFFFKNYARVEDSEDATIVRYWPEGEKPNAIICDLDGTLCNIEHRLHWVRGEGKDRLKAIGLFLVAPNELRHPGAMFCSILGKTESLDKYVMKVIRPTGNALRTL